MSSERVALDVAASDCFGAAPSDMKSMTIGSVWTLNGRAFQVSKVRHLTNGGLELVMQEYTAYKNTQVTIDHEGKYQ
jgi:hypothetical protein